MNQDYNKAVGALIKITVANNAGYIARKLREMNYQNKNIIPASELEANLFMLHAADTYEFYNLMKGFEWNKGNTNWTNDNKILNQLIEATKVHTGTEADRTNWWIISLKHLQNQANQ